jgi:hypothetical protein
MNLFISVTTLVASLSVVICNAANIPAPSDYRIRGLEKYGATGTNLNADKTAVYIG